MFFLHDWRISWQCASALRSMGSDGNTKKISLSFADYISIYFHPQTINLWTKIESVDIRWYVACQQWSSYIFPFPSDKVSTLCSRAEGLKDPIFFTQKSTQTRCQKPGAAVIADQAWKCRDDDPVFEAGFLASFFSDMAHVLKNWREIQSVLMFEPLPRNLVFKRMRFIIIHLPRTLRRGSKNAKKQWEMKGAKVWGSVFLLFFSACDGDVLVSKGAIQNLAIALRGNCTLLCQQKPRWYPSNLTETDSEIQILLSKNLFVGVSWCSSWENVDMFVFVSLPQHGLTPPLEALTAWCPCSESISGCLGKAMW